MARDIPFVPRFYIDELQYMKALGLFDINSTGAINNDFGNIEKSEAMKMFNFNPSDPYIQNNENANWLYPDGLKIEVPMYYKSDADIYNKKYCAVLGHNFYSGNVGFNLYDTIENSAIPNNSLLDINSVIGINNLATTPAYNGFSIMGINKPNYVEDSKLVFSMAQGNADDLYKFQVGMISYGNIFEMSISPDLKLSMSYEYGVDEKESRSGSTLSNVRWFQKPNWGKIGCWELDQDGQSSYLDDRENNLNLAHTRSGRRVYDLTFTFMTDDELLATNSGLSTYGIENDIDGNTLTDTDADGNSISITEQDQAVNIHTDHSFYSQVVHKTLGFSIPFIFQPNKDANRPQDFMLAKVDSKKGWKLNQIAPNLFRTKLRIKEVW